MSVVGILSNTMINVTSFTFTTGDKLLLYAYVYPQVVVFFAMAFTKYKYLASLSYSNTLMNRLSIVFE